MLNAVRALSILEKQVERDLAKRCQDLGVHPRDIARPVGSRVAGTSVITCENGLSQEKPLASQGHSASGERELVKALLDVVLDSNCSLALLDLRLHRQSRPEEVRA